MFTQNAFPILQPQNYQAYNRADMYVPSGGVPSSLGLAAMATPYAGGKKVHSVPVTYSIAKSQLIGTRSFLTPVKAVNSLGS